MWRPDMFLYSTSIERIYHEQALLEPKLSKGDISLPLPASMILESTSPVVAAAHQGSGAHTFQDITSWAKYMNQSPITVVVCSHSMPEEAMRAATTKLNAIFILPTPPGAEGDSPVNVMRSMDISAMSAMRGPHAIVLFAMQCKLYWFTGVRWPGLLDTHPEFGEDVTHLFTVQKLVTSAEPCHWGRIHAVGDQGLLRWNDELFSMDLLCEKICTMPIEQLTVPDMQQQLRDVLTSACVVWDGTQIQALVRTLVTYVDTLIMTKRTGPNGTNKTYQNMFNSSVALEDLTYEMGNKKRQARDRRRALKWLTCLLGSMTSCSGARKLGNGDTGTLMKQLGIKENVQKVTDMKTMQQLTAWISEKEEQDGGLVVPIIQWPSESTLLGIILSSVANSTFLELLNSETNNPALQEAFHFHPRALQVDGDTLAVLLQCSGNRHEMPLSPRDNGAAGMFLATEVNSLHQPSLGVPLDTIATSLENPEHVDWGSEASTPSFTNQVRVLLTLAISNARLVERGQHPPINPRDPGCRQLIVWVLLLTLRNFVKGKPLENKGTTVRDIARGFLYHVLCAAASGSKEPLMYIWQLVHDRPNQQLQLFAKGEAVFYLLFLECYPYTGWSLSTLRRNTARLIIRCIRKLVDPLTQPMRDHAKTSQKQQNKEMFNKRNAELRWLDLARTLTGKLWEEKGQSMLTDTRARSAFQRLESQAPSERGSKGYNMVLTFVRSVATTTETTEKHLRNTLKTLCNMTTKRSGMFGPFKNTIASNLAKGRPQQAKLSLDDIRLAQAQLGKVFDVEPGPGICQVQNMDNVVAAVQDSTDFRPVKGDAETKRGCFSLDSSPAYEPLQREKEIHYLMMGQCKTGIKEKERGEKEEDDTIIGSICKQKGHEAALEFYKTTCTLHIMDVVTAIDDLLTEDQFISLFKHVGVMEVDVNKVLRGIVAVLITQWKNPHVAENVALEIFR